MSFVPYISKWYKLTSVWVLTAIGVLSAVQPQLAALGVGETIQATVTGALAVLGVLARLVNQPSITEDGV